MKRLKLLLAVVLQLRLLVAAAFAQYQMPQDNWAFTDLHISGAFGALAVGRDDNLYVGSGGRIAVYTRAGLLLRQFGTNLSVRSIALDSNTNVYLLTDDTNHVLKFSPEGNLIRTFAGHGTNDDQVLPAAPPCGISIGSSNRVYVADTGNARIQVYDQDGNHLFHWGEYAGALVGGVLGRFSSIEGLAAMPNGDIAVRNGWEWNGSFNLNRELQLFDGDGHPLAIQFLGRELANENRAPNIIVASPDGLLAVLRGVNGVGALTDFVQLYSGGSSSGGTILTISGGCGVPAFDKGGNLYFACGSSITSAHRNLTNNKFGTNAVPLPYIVSARQRTNSSLVDIDYRVVGDVTNITTALLAFVNNGNDFSSLRKPTIFAENTKTNKGSNIAPNTDLRLTWDAAELATSFTNLQFEVLAKDDRGLFNLDFVTIPAIQGQPSLTMSRSGISNGDLLSVWYWLIATNDPTITLTNGVIKGIGGIFDQQSLTSGTATTPAGRTNIYQRLNVRAPSPEEIARAASGNYRFISVDANNVVKLP